MATTNPVKTEIKNLKAEYDRLAKGKESLLDIARRQTIPAFREKDVWKIGDYKP